jgi:hypothetical protein
MKTGITLTVIGGLMVAGPGILLAILAVRVVIIELGMSSLVPYGQGMVHGAFGIAVVMFLFIGVPGLFILRAGMRSITLHKNEISNTHA